MTMSLDDLALALQRAVDRLVRRLRRGAAPVPAHRRFLIVQIDGLSGVALDDGLASGRMPFLARLLERHGYRREPMAVGMPTSTPAFQMSAMYGVRHDIPGFHYYVGSGERTSTSRGRDTRRGSRPGRRRGGAASSTAGARTAAFSRGARRTTSSASPA